MTLIAVFNDSTSTQLVSDSLITSKFKDEISSSAGDWLSTGIYLDEKDQIKYKYSEGILKIWPIQNNLAIGLAGDVSLATNFLKVLVNYSRTNQFHTFNQLHNFINNHAFPSIIPFNGSCDLCGFLAEETKTTKFIISISEKDKINIVSSTDPNTYYSIGSGSDYFTNIWERIPGDELNKADDPVLIFSTIAEHLYKDQFIGKKDLITQTFIGGAISGIYYSDSYIRWQPSRTVVIFVNIGGTGFEAKFEWLPIVYKTWYERDSVFSSALFEQNGHYFQRITQYSNLLSQTYNNIESNLSAEMKSFHADQLSVILLPKGFSGENPAVLRTSGKLNAFDEIVEHDRIVGLRLNKLFFKNLEDNFFIAEDYTVKLGFDKLPPLIKSLRKQLDLMNKNQNKIAWVNKQGELAIRLMEYGGKTNSINILSEALSRFFDAHEIAKDCNLNLINDTEHNLNQFIKDINEKIKPEEVSMIIEQNKEAYKNFVRINT